MKDRNLVSSRTVYFLAAPLGNPRDLSFRAAELLSACDVVACEDTRVTGILLKEHGIKAQRLLSFNDINEAKRSEQMLSLLAEGKTIAVIPDGGSPMVSDPGFRFLRSLLESGEVNIEILPGPSAATLAFQWSNFGGNDFLFCGFLPKSDGDLEKKLRELSIAGVPLVAFESPMRIKKTLEVARSLFGEQRVVICRELTKVHEEIIRGNFTEVLEELGEDKVRGEITVVFDLGGFGKSGKDSSKNNDAQEKLVLKLVEEGLGARTIFELLKSSFADDALPKKKVYELMKERE